jgi:hypothetical protein
VGGLRHRLQDQQNLDYDDDDDDDDDIIHYGT